MEVRFAIVIFHIVAIYWLYCPIQAAQTDGLQSGSGVLKHFYNGIDEGA